MSSTRSENCLYTSPYMPMPKTKLKSDSPFLQMLRAEKEIARAVRWAASSNVIPFPVRRAALERRRKHP